MSECASGTPEEGKTSINFCVSPATILSLSTFIQSLVSVVCQSFTIKSLSQEARGKMGFILETGLPAGNRDGMQQFKQLYIDT